MQTDDHTNILPFQLKRSAPPMSDNNKAKMIRGAAWIGTARIATILLGLASTIILARFLTPDDFGLIAIATATAATVASLTELSLAQAIIQHDDPKDHHYDTVFTLNFLKTVFATCLVLAVAYPVSIAYGDERLFYVLLGIAFSAFVGGIENPRMIGLQKELQFKQEFIVRLVERLSGFVVAVTVAVVYESYWAFVIAAVISQICKNVTAFALVPKLPRFGLRGTRELLSFSIWLTLGHLVNTVNQRSDPLILGLFVPTSRLGIYTFADNIAKMPAGEGLTPLRVTLFPAFAKLKYEPMRLRTAYCNAQGVLALLAFPLCFGLSSLAEPTVSILFGEKWLPSVHIIAVLAAAIALQSVSAFSPLAMALGDSKRLFTLSIKALFVRLILFSSAIWIGQEFFGEPVLGAVYGAVASIVFVLGLTMIEVRKLIDVSIAHQLGLSFNAAVSASCMWLVIMMTQSWMPVDALGLLGFVQMMVHVVIGGAVYVALASLIWVLRGRPNGSEKELLELTLKLFAKAKSTLIDKKSQVIRNPE